MVRLEKPHEGKKDNPLAAGLIPDIIDPIRDMLPAILEENDRHKKH